MFGQQTPTYFFTDHRNLKHILKPKLCNNKTYLDCLKRWELQLPKADIIIEHIPGEDNFFADLLFRWAQSNENRGDCSPGDYPGNMTHNIIPRDNRDELDNPTPDNELVEKVNRVIDSFRFDTIFADDFPRQVHDSNYVTYHCHDEDSGANYVINDQIEYDSIRDRVIIQSSSYPSKPNNEPSEQDINTTTFLTKQEYLHSFVEQASSNREGARSKPTFQFTTSDQTQRFRGNEQLRDTSKSGPTECSLLPMFTTKSERPYRKPPSRYQGQHKQENQSHQGRYLKVGDEAGIGDDRLEEIPRKEDRDAASSRRREGEVVHLVQGETSTNERFGGRGRSRIFNHRKGSSVRRR